jgi:hypothetical protein
MANLLVEIFKITLPSIVVFLTAYLIIRSFFERQEQEDQQKLKVNVQEQVLPLRLQAYERMILFLERIHPDNLISRVRESNMTAADLQVALLKDIRNEYSHNLSQQLYVSEDAWVLTQNAKEEMIKLINLCYGHVKPDDSAMELTRIIINTLMQSDKSPTEPAIRYIKQEVGTLF